MTIRLEITILPTTLVLCELLLKFELRLDMY